MKWIILACVGLGIPVWVIASSMSLGSWANAYILFLIGPPALLLLAFYLPGWVKEANYRHCYTLMRSDAGHTATREWEEVVWVIAQRMEDNIPGRLYSCMRGGLGDQKAGLRLRELLVPLSGKGGFAIHRVCHRVFSKHFGAWDALRILLADFLFEARAPISAHAEMAIYARHPEIAPAKKAG